MSSYILDSSAIIAMIQKEKGASEAAAYIKSSIMSSVNFSEVVAVLARKMPREIIITLLPKLVTEVVPFDQIQAIETGVLSQKTKHIGLSLGDRACLSLAMLRKLPILTAEAAWQSLNLGIEIKNIRL